jgi:DNA-directed RNA polymerase specialized sigma24 family protein
MANTKQARYRPFELDRGEPVFDGELVEALRDETVRRTTREISRLPERERRLVLGIVRQFGEPGVSDETG